MLVAPDAEHRERTGAEHPEEDERLGAPLRPRGQEGRRQVEQGQRRSAVEHDAGAQRPHADLLAPLPPEANEDDADHDEERDPQQQEDDPEAERAGLPRRGDEDGRHEDDEEAAKRPVRAGIPVGHDEVV